jgi:hypothetical protein
MREYSYSADSFDLRDLRARGFPRLPSVPFSLLDGKEGVDGSSPSGGSAKAPHNGPFCFGSICRFSNVGQVWSPLWSLQVKTRSWRAASPDRAPPNGAVAGS